MSAKNAKKTRKEIQRHGASIYDEIKRQVNALTLRNRWRIAWLILRGAW